MDDSAALALEGSQSAIPWPQAGAEGRRAHATAADGRHRDTANSGANKPSRPSTVRFIHTQRVPRSAAVWRDAVGGGEGGELQHRNPGQCATGHSRNRWRPANQRTATFRAAIQPAIYDTRAQVKSGLRSGRVPERLRLIDVPGLSRSEI